MNILLTGSNGFIGSKIRNYLQQRHHKLFEIINPESSKEKKLEASKIYFFNLKEDNLDMIFEKFNCENIEVVIHCAALTNNNANNKDLFLTNTLGTNTIFLLAKRLRVKKFIYLSGLSVIGKPINIPIKEDHPIDPLNIYHTSKYCGEKIINLDKDNFLEKITLRITAPVGLDLPKNRFLSRLIINCLSNKDLILFGQGCRVQNYIHTDDICRFIEICIRKKFNGIFNLGGISSIANLDLAKLCIKKTNSESSIKFIGKDIEEDFRWIVSMEKAKSNLGFEPKYDIDYIVEEQISNLK